jgi:hypothetical protein
MALFFPTRFLHSAKNTSIIYNLVAREEGDEFAQENFDSAGHFLARHIIALCKRRVNHVS